MKLAAQIINGLFCDELFEGPFVDTSRSLVVKLLDVLCSTRKYRAFVLFAAWYMLCKLVDALIDGFATTTFDCIMLVSSLHNEFTDAYLLCGYLSAVLSIHRFPVAASTQQQHLLQQYRPPYRW